MLQVLRNRKLQLAALAVALIIGAQLGIRSLDKSTKSSPVALALAAEAVGERVTQFVVMGCAQAAVASGNQGIILAIAMSQGQVCLQVVGQTIAEAVEGRSVCSNEDTKCLFTLGYVQTQRRALGQQYKTEEEIKNLEAEVDQAYEKALAAQPQ